MSDSPSAAIVTCCNRFNRQTETHDEAEKENLSILSLSPSSSKSITRWMRDEDANMHQPWPSNVNISPSPHNQFQFTHPPVMEIFLPLIFLLVVPRRHLEVLGFDIGNRGYFALAHQSVQVQFSIGVSAWMNRGALGVGGGSEIRVEHQCELYQTLGTKKLWKY